MRGGAKSALAESLRARAVPCPRSGLDSDMERVPSQGRRARQRRRRRRRRATGSFAMMRGKRSGDPVSASAGTRRAVPIPCAESEGTVSNQEVLQQRDEVGGRRQGVTRPLRRPATRDERAVRSRGGGWNNRRGSQARAGCLPRRGHILIGGSQSARAASAARRRLVVPRAVNRGATGGEAVTRGASTAAPFAGAVRAAAGAPAAAARAASGAEAERLHMPVGAAADEVGRAGEQHQCCRQPYLSHPGHPAKGPHN